MTNKVITETLEMGLKIIEQREEIDRLTAEVERLRGVLELIASPDQCSDEQYWMVKRARDALRGET